MTIAAGFKIKDGILLCADTQLSAGMKLHESKILKAQFGKKEEADKSAAVLVAIAGPVRFARVGALDCLKKIGSGLTGDELTIPKIADVFREGLRSFYANDVHPSPLFLRGELNIQYLVAIQAKGKSELFASDNAVIEPVDSAPIGSGSYLAPYFITPIREFLPEMEVEEAAIWATHMLMQVKAYDEYCGGWSELQMLGNDGSISRTGHFEISVREKFLEQFEVATRKLFGSAMLDSDDKRFQTRINAFQVEMIKARQAWKEAEPRYAELFKALRKRLR